MGFFKKLKKFGHKLSADAHKLGTKVNKTVGKAVDYAEKKALPVAEKVASGLKKGISLAEPLVGSVAPELIPALEAGKKLSGMAEKGLNGAEKGISTVKAGQAKAVAMAKQAEAGVSKAVKGDFAGAKADLSAVRSDVERVNPLKR